jgi:hypothetical protein
MDFDEIVKEIKRIHSISTNKDSEVYLTYKGTSGGISKPFNLKIDNREANATSSKEAALALFLLIKDDMLSKITVMEKQVSFYKEALGNDAKEL